jgi:rod shape-determining protein MreD
MTYGLWHKLDIGARIAAPSLVVFMLVLLSVVPLRIPYYAPVAPLLPIVAVYYWTIHRGDLMPAWVIFLLGLLYGILVGAPLGIHAVVFLACSALVAGQRRSLVGKSFLVLWWGFALVIAVGTAVEWLLFSAWFWQGMPVRPAVYRALLTLALFPPITWVFIQVHRGFVHRV